MSFFLSRSGIAQTMNFSKAADSGDRSALNAPPTSWIDLVDVLDRPAALDLLGVALEPDLHPGQRRDVLVERRLQLVGHLVVIADSTWRARSILGTHSVVRCSENVFCCVK